MKNQSEIRVEITNLIRDWDNQDDTPDKLSHRDLAIKIEDVYLLYAQQVAEDVRQRCADNAEANYGFEAQLILATDSILNTEIILS